MASRQDVDKCFAEHLPYEVAMLRVAIDMLSKAKGHEWVINMAIENFCVHARNLIEFFKKSKHCDFEPTEFTTEAFKYAEPFFPGQTLRRIDTQIAHLTRDRTKGWTTKITAAECHGIYETLEAEISRFENDLTPTNKTRWKVNYPRQVLSRALSEQVSTTTITGSTSVIWDPQKQSNGE